MSIAGYVSFLLFPILVLFWSRSGMPTFAYLIAVSEPMKTITIWMFNQLVPITGIFATYKFFDLIINYQFILKNKLIAVGKISLEIYCTHFYFFSFTCLMVLMPIGLRVALTFLITLAGTILTQWLLKKSTALSMVLYGKFK